MSQLSRRLALILLGSAALLPAMRARAATLGAPPADLATRDAALVRVRSAILQAVAARDFKRLRPHLDPKIQLDFGGGSGIAEFERRLARGPVLWEELRWVLEHGGRFLKDRTFWAPYTFSAEIGKLDAYEAGIVVDENVPARAQPRPEAPLVATLGRTAVKVTDWRHGEKTPKPFYKRRDWVKIELPGKGPAWIEAKHVRAAVDYRAGFVKARGVWTMNAFIAGD